MDSVRDSQELRRVLNLPRGWIAARAGARGSWAIRGRCTDVRIGSLFSGIGGLELGLERAGLGRVVWQVEIDSFCRRVLAKHWPEALRYADVCEVGRNTLAPVDVICGGFPCQDVSSAGKRAGLAGAKSGLWREYRRIVADLRPRIVVVENVTSGKKLWLPTVRGDLESLGYRVRAYALSAADVGAPHLRRRVFVVADADGESKSAFAEHAEVAGASALVADADGERLRQQQGRRERPDRDGRAVPAHLGWGQPEPDVVRVVHGLSRGVDGRRRRALGNAVVPQCAEAVGRVIADGLRPR